MSNDRSEQWTDLRRRDEVTSPTRLSTTGHVEAAASVEAFVHESVEANRSSGLGNEVDESVSRRRHG